MPCANEIRWLDDTPARLQCHNLHTLEEEVVRISPELYKPWNEALLQIWEQARVTMPTAAELKAITKESLSREEYETMFRKMMEEVDEGFMINFQKLVVVISQKES